jgi:hypothetical protein
MIANEASELKSCETVERLMGPEAEAPPNETGRGY